MIENRPGGNSHHRAVPYILLASAPDCLQIVPTKRKGVPGDSQEDQGLPHKAVIWIDRADGRMPVAAGEPTQPMQLLLRPMRRLCDLFADEPRAVAIFVMLAVQLLFELSCCRR